MKKNLLAAIAVFLFTFVVLLIMSNASDKENNQDNELYYVVEK
jgi:Na+/H+ antiporter NhaC